MRLKYGTPLERKHNASALKQIRHALDAKPEPRLFPWPLIALVALCLIASCRLAYSADVVVTRHELVAGYTLNAWVNAIHRAEGNENYGILSVKCSKGEGCRRICANTVRNNWARYLKTTKAPRKAVYASNKASFEPFLNFLAGRYCPISASNDPHGLNRNWKRNVKYWLSELERRN